MSSLVKQIANWEISLEQSYCSWIDFLKNVIFSVFEWLCAKYFHNWKNYNNDIKLRKFIHIEVNLTSRGIFLFSSFPSLMNDGIWQITKYFSSFLNLIYGGIHKVKINRKPLNTESNSWKKWDSKAKQQAPKAASGWYE